MGTGKSTLIKYMGKKPNCFIINIDEVVQEIYKRNIFIEKTLKNIFFCKKDKITSNIKIYSSIDNINQELERKELGKIVFNQEEKLHILNKIIWGEVRKKIKLDLSKLEFDLNYKNQQKLQLNKYFVFIEGAVIIEAGYYVKLKFFEL